MKVKFKKLDPRAVTPTYATDGSGALDISALPGEPFTLHPGDEHAHVFRTGLAFEVPPGYGMLILSRSGHGFTRAMRLSNAVGLLDSDYRGEMRVALRCDGDARGHLSPGDRVAQAFLVQMPRLDLEEVDELSDTARGTGGFGSTGS